MNLIKRILFGKEPQGEKVELSTGTLRIQSTYEPEEKASLNEVFANAHQELQRIAQARYGSALPSPSQK